MTLTFVNYKTKTVSVFSNVKSFYSFNSCYKFLCDDLSLHYLSKRDYYLLTIDD